MGAKDRRQREREQRRKQILDAARKILLKKGMAAVSMNQIAAACELSVGTLYLYFKNKEELFAALQEEGLELLYQMIRDAAAGGDSPRDKLERISMAYLEFSERHRKYFDIINYFLTSSEVMFPSHLKERIDRHGDRILSIVEGVLIDGAADLPVEKGQERRLALLLWSSLHGLLQFRKLQDTILSGVDYKDLYRFGVERAIRSLLCDD